MSFNVPVKALNPVDIKLPDHVVKGAVTVDSSISEWNPLAKTKSTEAAFITIDKLENNLLEVITLVCNKLGLPECEEYALAFEDPHMFLTASNIHTVAHGFMLKITASPNHYAKRLKAIFTGTDSKKNEWALEKLVQLAKDPCFIEAFYQESDISLLYSLLGLDNIKSNPNMVCNILHALSSMLDQNISNVNWTSVPQSLIDQLANNVTGGVKVDDTNTVIISLQIIESLVNCDSEEIRQRVLAAVRVEALFRHLEKSNENVNLAALTVMNALHKSSDEQGKKDIIELLTSNPFRTAIAGSVLRNGRAREASLIHQLYTLQLLVSSEQAKLMTMSVQEEEYQQLLESDVFLSSASTESEIDLLKSSSLGRLLFSVLTKYTANNEEDMKILLSENAKRGDGSGWQFIPMSIQCLTIVCELLSVIPTDDNCVEQLIELLYTLDSPIDSLFAVVVQLFHRTWREMHASQGESLKVGKVVREQLWRCVDNTPLSLSSLNNALQSLSYWKIQELWKKEEIMKENDQLSSEIVSELRRLLTPSVESLVIQNRKNFMKQGFTFKRLVKGKSALKDQYWFWKLDQAEKVITMIETDSDPYMDGFSHVGAVRKVCIKDIKEVPWGNDGTTTMRKGTGTLRDLRIRLKNDEVISASASSDKPLLMWIDGLMHLIGDGLLSRDANRLVNRLLNVELRLRLLDVPQPQTNLPVPDLPTDFSWLKPHMDQA